MHAPPSEGRPSEGNVSCYRAINRGYELQVPGIATSPLSDTHMRNNTAWHAMLCISLYYREREREREFRISLLRPFGPRVKQSRVLSVSQYMFVTFV